ncbi:MAG: RHS repeat-associated core domain-containing protein [Paludibacteraceae bacterium]|nr:RHS repeat-associated core domain-containing protein [Paludibacteraceae bacterium]
MNQPSPTYRPTTAIAMPCDVEIFHTFTGKEKDPESGYHYFGARYYDCEALTGWLSVDPMADKYPSLSPYNYCAWNPVKLIDPDGNEMWKPEVLADGSVNYIKEAGDNAKTLQDQYGLTESDAKKLYNTVKNGKISASDVKKVTGDNILKLDWNSSSDYQKIYHAMAALLHGVVTGRGADANMNNYFSNIQSNKDKRMYMGEIFYTVDIRGNFALPLLDGKEFRATYASIAISKQSPIVGNPQPIKPVLGTNDFTHTYNHPGGNLPLLHLRMDCANMEKYEKVYY